MALKAVSVRSGRSRYRVERPQVGKDPVADDALTLGDILDQLVDLARRPQSSDNFRSLALAAQLDISTDFIGADLRNLDLYKQDLRGFDFSGADLTNADLRGANLDGVSIVGATLGGVLGLEQAENPHDLALEAISRGELDLAQRLLEDALQLALDTRDMGLAAQECLCLADVSALRRSPAEACDWMHRGITYGRQAAPSPIGPGEFEKLGTWQSELGLHQEAQLSYLEAAEGYGAASVQDAVRIHHRLAGECQALGHYVKAEDSLRIALSLSKECQAADLVITSFISLFKLMKQVGDLREAYRWISQAQRLSNEASPELKKEILQALVDISVLIADPLEVKRWKKKLHAL